MKSHLLLKHLKEIVFWMTSCSFEFIALDINCLFFSLTIWLRNGRGEEITRKVNSSSFSDRISTDEGRRKTCLSILSVLNLTLDIFSFFLWETHKQSLPSYLNLSQFTKPPKQPKLGSSFKLQSRDEKERWSSWWSSRNFERWFSQSFSEIFWVFYEFSFQHWPKDLS